jgi:2-desacetyl-2-hydroxyethyl bacteriochlorophyllide A dehydrogenase
MPPGVVRPGLASQNDRGDIEGPGGAVRAAIMRDGQLVVDEVPDRAPAPGQLLVEVLACGICGSDLHVLDHTDDFVAMTQLGAEAAGPLAPEVLDPGRDVVMGHEFCGRVLEVGENVGNSRPGDVVVSVPMVLDADGPHPVGYSNEYPGGYAERLLLSDLLCFRVPNGLDPRHAALTEPMAVGLHAVESSRVDPRHAAVVIGCGPVGLATVAALRLAGVECIVAADPSPARRRLAATLGATEVVDPGEEPPVAAWRRVDGRRPLVLFEAVGVPGLLDAAMAEAPRASQVVVVGVCLVPDTVRPMLGVVKELNLQFVLGYDLDQFGRTLRRIAEGEIDVDPMITGEVDLDGVAAAFAALSDPEAHAKILVVPG